MPAAYCHTIKALSRVISYLVLALADCLRLILVARARYAARRNEYADKADAGN